MNAEIIAVGSELLTPARTDTNSLWLTARLNEIGVEVVAKAIVGDHRERLAGMVRAGLERSDILIVTGGLGPTEDDVTREAVALALGRQLEFRQEICDAIAERFARLGRTMAAINRRQAYVIEGFEALPNPAGTAPGLWGLLGGKVVLLLPGPPRELQPMFLDACLPRLVGLAPPLAIRTLTFRVAGMPESELDQLISPVYTKYANPVTTVLAKPGDIEIHLRARCSGAREAEGLLQEVGSQIEALLGDRIYSRNGDSLEAVVGAMLRERRQSVSVAESCTGGLLGQRLTDVPGSSDYFWGGFLTYTEQMKIKLLGVPAEELRQHGAVSEACARAMAEAARALTGSDYALSITGYAGPEGGTEENPVGTVFIGLAAAKGTRVRRLRFPGDRSLVRALAAQSALDLLRREMLAGA
jgi:nicotinamide-nucleotide amidase